MTWCMTAKSAPGRRFTTAGCLRFVFFLTARLFAVTRLARRDTA